MDLTRGQVSDRGADVRVGEAVTGVEATGDGFQVETEADSYEADYVVLATGAMVRAEKWQAVIAAGDGGAAALDILSTEKGGHYHDFDVPDDVPTFGSEYTVGQNG